MDKKVKTMHMTEDSMQVQDKDTPEFAKSKLRQFFRTVLSSGTSGLEYTVSLYQAEVSRFFLLVRNKLGYCLGLFYLIVISCCILPANATSCTYNHNTIKHYGFMSYFGPIPLNSRGVLWDGDISGSTPPGKKISLGVKTADGQVLALETERVYMGINKWPLWLLRPQAGFKPGTRYIFYQQMEGTSSYNQLEVKVSEVAVYAPEHRVKLTLSEPIKNFRSKCELNFGGEDLRKTLYTIKMELPESLEPFRRHFYFETIIDGQQTWSYQSDQKPSNPYTKGEDWLFYYSTCPKYNLLGLPPGRHKVEIRATLPGTLIQIHSLPVEITSECKPAPITPPSSL